MEITLTPEMLANMQPEDPDKIYTYSSYDIRGFEYTFKGTPAEYRADKEERRKAYRDSMKPPISYLPIQGQDLKEMRLSLIQRIKHWINPNPLEGWKLTQETETYISPKVRDEKFW